MAAGIRAELAYLPRGWSRLPNRGVANVVGEDIAWGEPEEEADSDSETEAEMEER